MPIYKLRCPNGHEWEIFTRAGEEVDGKYEPRLPDHVCCPVCDKVGEVTIGGSVIWRVGLRWATQNLIDGRLGKPTAVDPGDLGIAT